MSGRLVLVGTPIGNLEDLSPRAAAALAGADTICCEDTRRTRALLAALGIRAPRLVRLDAHTERQRAPVLAEQIAAGAVVALVSDAGMPAVSDPGSFLVKTVAGRGLDVDAVPGPSAASTALALSGLPGGQYRFAGFLPRKGGDRRRAVAAVAAAGETTVIYEAANRVAATVADLAEVCGPRREVAVARELTKVHQEVWRGDLAGAGEWLAGREPRGEFVLVVGGAPPTVAGEADPARIAAALVARIDAGWDRRTAVAAVAAELGRPKKEVYAVSVNL
jgi:16S rRNA (cytidine1402-2'-O)-methyltransferase